MNWPRLKKGTKKGVRVEVKTGEVVGFVNQGSGLTCKEFNKIMVDTKELDYSGVDLTIFGLELQ